MYELDFPASLSLIHPMFHVSTLEKFVGDPSMIVPVEDVGVTDSSLMRKSR